MIQDLKQLLLYQMLRIRRIEEAISLRYTEQKMRCPIHFSIGQEAIAVGVCSQLKKEDAIFSNHRSHAHFLAKGGCLHKMVAELYGKKTGCTKGRGGSMHLIDLDVGFQGSSPLVAGSIPIAAGFALANQMKRSSAICGVFFGEAATEEGVFAETLNFAALKNLPLLLVCENNRYAAYSPTSERQSPNRNRVKIAEAHGVFALSGNGNNMEETYRVTEKALTYIRSGKGPVFIEFETYRLCKHVGARTPQLDAKSNEEIATWKEHCPLKLYQEQLFKEQMLSQEILKNWETEINTEIKSAFTFAEESPFPIFDLDDEKAYAE